MTIESESTQATAPKNNNTLLIGIVVIAIIAAVSYTVLAPKNNTEQNAQTTKVAQPVAEATKAPAMVKAGTYKNGTYEAVGEYTVPGAKETLGVNITLKDGVISAVEVKELAKLPISKMKQADFAAHYKDQVMGKNIDEVKLTKVSGSSLTPKGFNDALGKIKTQAKS